MTSNLSFQQTGHGHPVVLLHGFPFHREIWNSLAQKLSPTYHIFTVDLPGFGKSPLLNTPFTIDDVGQSVVSWVTGMNFTKQPVLIGHSLGGYVALAAANLKPRLFSALALFHSTAYADTEEKKQSRNKVLEFIDKKGVEAFTSNFINPLFVNQEHPAITAVRALAMQASHEAVTGYTVAMRDRPERTDVLQNFSSPILFLAGAHDPGISVESIRKQASVTAQPQVHILANTAHMGMFESETECLEIIKRFIEKAQLPGSSGRYKTPN